MANEFIKVLDRETKQDIRHWARRYKGYESPVRTFLKWCEDSNRFELTMEVLADYRDYIAPKYQPSTVRNKLSSLKSLYKYLSFADDNRIYVDHDLSQIRSGVQVRHNGALSHRIFTHEELDNFYVSARREYQWVVRALFHSGVRISELHQMNLNRMEYRPHLGEYVQTVKTKTGERELRLSTQIFEALVAFWQDSRDEEGNLFGMKLNTFNKAVSREIKRHGGHTLSAHSTRHTLGTYMVEAGIDYSEIQQRLGHSDISITLRFYVKSRYTEAGQRVIEGLIGA